MPSQKLLLLDNYDSFTYNLHHLVMSVDKSIECDVIRNDKIERGAVSRYDKIIFSPGPGLPLEAGLMADIMRDQIGKIPLFGVCLGHQCLGEVMGAKLKNLSSVVHGKGTPCRVLDAQDTLFKGLPETFTVGRYHSWVVDTDALPDSLVVTAVDDAGFIMGERAKDAPAWGVQFHPESILTEYGKEMMKNFLNFRA